MFRIKLKDSTELFSYVTMWPTSWKISQFFKYSGNTSLGNVVLATIFTRCWSFISPFVSLYFTPHFPHFLWAAVQFLCRNQKLVWWADSFKRKKTKKKQTLCIPEFAYCLTDEWKLLMVNTLNKSFVHFDKKKVSFLYSKKDRIILYNKYT